MSEYESTTHPFKRRKNGKNKGKACSIMKHRKIWMEHYGEIPKGFIIHHKNRNKKDNMIGNLSLISHSQHSKIHCCGKKTKHKKQKTITLNTLILS